MKAKKVLVTVLAAAALVTASVFGTMAYLTDKDEVTNTFTVGHVDITLDETAVGEDGKPIDGAERVKENDFHLIPGSKYTKDPMVTVKAGSEASYVRMFMTITNADAWDDICDKYAAENLDITDMMLGYDGTNWEFQSSKPNGDGTRTFEFWYKEAVAGKNGDVDADVELDALFDEIYIPGYFTNADLKTLENFKINVIAQAIQAENFDDAADAWGTGWDEEVPAYDAE